MDQVLAILHIQEKLSKLISTVNTLPTDKITSCLENISQDLDAFLDKGIDFKVVVDSIDDSVFIADKDGVVLYINPAYTKNTEITPEEIIGRSVYDIISENKLFSGGATLDVIKNNKKAFRLSTTYKTNPPRTGYAVGSPIFDSNNNLHQIVVCSRPILSLAELQEDFERFVQELNSLKDFENIKIHTKANTSDLNKDIVKSPTGLDKLLPTIQMVAPTDATVLITGESGVGKEVVSDAIYKNSNRTHKPYVKINCASIPATLLESELFGYEKGAFSGANTSGKQGLFETANGGTLLLDEIGDMSLDLQVKLLRAIQNKEITRIGGTKPIPLDIRILAATNSNLKEKIQSGSFRSDLYYRLNVVPIHIPPLRERSEDIESFCQHFIQVFSQKYQRKICLATSQLNKLKMYNWPGNIRELENVIEYLTIFSSGIGEVDDLVFNNLLDISQHSVSHEPVAFDLNTSVMMHEKEMILKVLKSTKNLRDAGAILGVNASTLSRKIKQYNIDYNKAK